MHKNVSRRLINRLDDAKYWHGGDAVIYVVCAFEWVNLLMGHVFISAADPDRRRKIQLMVEAGAVPLGLVVYPGNLAYRPRSLPVIDDDFLPFDNFKDAGKLLRRLRKIHWRMIPDDE